MDLKSFVSFNVLAGLNMGRLQNEDEDAEWRRSVAGQRLV